jgi:hypothetical protein
MLQGKFYISSEPMLKPFTKCEGKTFLAEVIHEILEPVLGDPAQKRNR